MWLGDLPVAVLSIGPPSYIAPDHLGAPHEITNASKRVEWQWDHDPFGNGLPTGPFSYGLRFPGQFYDQRSKLNYNYFRDYDPNTGRYIESDPIGLAGGVNTYGYVGQNPVRASDALGLCEGDKRDCMNNFLRSRAGDAFVDKYVQTFSAWRLFDNPNNSLLSLFVIEGAKFGPGLVLIDLGNKMIDGSASLPAVYYGWNVQNFGVGWLKVFGAASVGATVGATYADFLAYLWCSIPDPTSNGQ